MPDNQVPNPEIPQTPAIVPTTETQANSFAAKYGNNWDEAGKGYFEIVRQRQNVEVERDNATNRAKALEEMLLQRVNPAERTTERLSAKERIRTELGLDPEIFGDLIREEVAGTLAPVVRGYEARNVIASEHPDFSQIEGEMMNWLKINPSVGQRYGRMAAADPEAALDWAITKFKGEKGMRVSASGAAEQAAARTAGSIPSSMAPAGRAGAEAQVAMDEEKRALDYYGQFGDERPYLHARLADEAAKAYPAPKW